MRREHNIQQSYIDWLKSLGCVFYAPMLNNGDTMDYISGNTLIVNGGTVTWDTSKNAYKFYGPTSNTYLASWNDLDMNLNINNLSFTYLYELWMVNSPILPIALGGRQMAVAIGSEGVLNRFFKFSQTWSAYDGVNPVTENVWFDDTLMVSRNRGNQYWTITDIGKQRLECNTNMTNKTYYLKNVYVFNRNLTLNEIQSIQQNW